LRVGMPISIALARRGLIKRFLRREAIKFCYKRAEVIIANHGAVAKDISEVTGISEHLIHVIPNGTVSQLLYDLAEATPDHPWLSKKDSPVVLAIGRLAKQKDFSTLIRAFHTVRAELNAKLIILGEGKERSNLQSLINRLRLDDCVHLYGYAENPYCFLNRADLFVLSSAWEGLPNVLIEAIALGVPSVATDCKSGPREILEDGRLGPLVPVGDDKAMAESILHTLATPPNRDLLVKSASRYRADTCAKRYLEALKLG
ncbi:MAG: glycosyltransferase, partial [Deltaproteobacteria bacterium]